jgi:DNA-binding NarL/FixJ family response regulator
VLVGPTREPVTCPTTSELAMSLPPRARETLSHLLRGLSEKEVAQAMHRSQHTVHCHVRYLYRHFAVSTRAELLSRIFRGGATDSAGVQPPSRNQG